MRNEANANIILFFGNLKDFSVQALLRNRQNFCMTYPFIFRCVYLLHENNLIVIAWLTFCVVPRVFGMKAPELQVAVTDVPTVPVETGFPLFGVNPGQAENKNPRIPSIHNFSASAQVKFLTNCNSSSSSSCFRG